MGRLKLNRKPGGIRGPLPPPFERCDWEIERRPSDDWMDINREAFNRGEIEPGDVDMYVGVNLYGYHVVPKDNLPPSQWPQGRTLLLTVQEVPFVSFRAECLQDMDRRNAPKEQEPENHRADLAEVAEKAIAAHRAAKVAPGEFAMTEDEAAEALAPVLPWWRRLWLWLSAVDR